MKNHLCSESISSLFGNDENTDGKSSFMLKAGSENGLAISNNLLTMSIVSLRARNEFKQFIRCSRKSSLFAV
jgi:hypothetical protein